MTDPQSSAPTGAELTQIVDILTVLEQRLTALEQNSTTPAAAPPDPESAAEQERRFELWVDWLNRAYCLDDATYGWDHVDGVRYELEALFTWYEAAHGPDARPGESVQWHDALARALPRIAGVQLDHRKAAQRGSTSRVPEHQRWQTWLDSNPPS